MASIEFISGILCGGLALEEGLDILSHNIANLDTPGYRRQVLSFVVENPNGESSPEPLAVRTLRALDLSQGMIKPTGNPLDLAISGEGFFVVETPQGERYTRKGSFQLDGEGFLVTPEGYRVLGLGGPIQIQRGGSVVVNEGGDVIVDGELVDTLRIVTFPKGTPLKAEGSALIRAEGEPEEAEGYSIKQGHLEGSNVSPIEEMTRLVELSRRFEAYQKALQTSFEDISRKLLQEVIKA